MNKICSKCKVEKPISNYTIDRHNKGGYKHRCNSCIAEYIKSYFKKKGYGGGYYFVKKRRDRIKIKYGFGSGSLWRYGLKILIPLYKKYNSCCANCFSKNNLTIHHIDGKGSNYVKKGLKPNNSFGNLLLVCRKCHGSIDGKMNWGRKKFILSHDNIDIPSP